MNTKLIAVLILGALPAYSYSLADVVSEQAFSDEAFNADEASNFVYSFNESTADGEKLFAATPEDLNRSKVVIIVNKSNFGSTAQTVRVYVDARLVYNFKTSTGREKTEIARSGNKTRTTTPIGYYRPYLLERNHFSKQWKADMPFTIFFNGGIALHATTKSHYPQLGTRASGGCARLEFANAKTIYDLIRSVGVKKVEVIGSDGKTVLKKDGTVKMTETYDTLVIVENRI